MSSLLLVLLFLSCADESFGFTVDRTVHGMASRRTSMIQNMNRNKNIIESGRSLRLHQSTAVASDASTSSDVVALDWISYNADETTAASSTAPPVILLHGLLGSKRNFASLAASLDAQLATPRRIFGVDLRNHGTSAWRETMSYADMAEDVLHFMDSQNIQSAVIVGHSMGGKVAQAMALTHGMERVAGLVVLDIAPVSYCPERDAHWRAVADVLHTLHKVNDVAQLNSALPDPALRAFCLTNYDTRRKEWKVPLETLVDQIDVLAGFDIKDQRAVYDGDAFFINGGQSKFVRHKYMDTIASYFPNHMLTTIRSAGHWIHAEAPDATVALLKRYLDR